MAVLLRSAHLDDGRQCDVALVDGVVSWMGAVGSYSSDVSEEVDLEGFILLPSFVEPHAHLDKAFLADRVPNPTGDLMGAINGLEAIRSTITHDDLVQRAVRAAELMSRNGVTAVRTHADTTVTGGLSSVMALLEAKRLCAHFIDIQVAMLLEWPLTGALGSERRALAVDAIAAGVDVVGGCPHLDPDPKGATEYLFDLALEHGLPLDVHADENLRADSSDLEHLADIVLSHNVVHPINASHCVSLSVRSPEDISRIAEKVSKADISVTALPHTNLFLQGRGVATRAPRAITPIRELLTAGVTVAAGADNLQDPFNLMGRGDPLEIASLLVIAAHVSPKDAQHMITNAASKVVRGAPSLIAPGQRADLTAVRATTLREAIAMGPPDRCVVYGGVVLDDQKRNRK